MSAKVTTTATDAGELSSRASAAIGELLSVIKDAKQHETETEFRSSMWEAEARTWKERYVHVVLIDV